MSNSDSKPRSRTKTQALNSDDVGITPKPRASIAKHVAVKRAPTATRPWPLDDRSNTRSEGEASGTAKYIKDEEGELSLAQVAPAASTVSAVYQVLSDSQEPWGEKQTKELGTYLLLQDANSIVLETWRTVCDEFHRHARSGTEDDGRFWWEANRPDAGRHWVRIKEIRIQSPNRKMDGWGDLPPANAYWSNAKSLKDEESRARAAEQQSSVKSGE